MLGLGSGLPADHGRGAVGEMRRCPLCGFNLHGRSGKGHPVGNCCYKCATDEGTGSWDERSPPRWLLPQVLSRRTVCYDEVARIVTRVVGAVNSAEVGGEPQRWRVADVQGGSADVTADVHALREAYLNSNIRTLYARVGKDAAETAARRCRLPRSVIDAETQVMVLHRSPPKTRGVLLKCTVRLGNVDQKGTRVAPLCEKTVCRGPHSWPQGDSFLVPCQQQVVAVEIVRAGPPTLVLAVALAAVLLLMWVYNQPRLV
eukprot:TRINITY_DN22814_c0_g1_i1.p1 TRINITY_DN22814_c0_g1~~TRINITY_DN22814_c0_g1_i1.p1  ORF type:complete len:259 (+),score=35.68 TRINITY_DN22814_c0_g1_i1:56-832(+)